MNYMFNSRSTAPVPPKKKQFRILALDGGGVRAILQATILSRLTQHFPLLMQEIDMFAGTSAGCIVAGALAVGLTPDAICNIWTSEVGKIFSEAFSHKIGSLDSLVGAAYTQLELKTMLHNLVGEIALKDLKHKFLSPVFHLHPESEKENPRWHPVFYHNFPSSKNAETPLADVILRTSAAPTYFPICESFVDGGTFANNPSMVAVSTSIREGIELDSLSVLSISTGLNPKFISKQEIGSGNWGLYEWGPHLIDLLLESNVQSINYECQCLLKDRYYRLDPIIPFNVGLDDARAVPELIKLAHSLDIHPLIDWIEKSWGLKNEVDTEKPIELFPQNPSSNWGCLVQ